MNNNSPRTEKHCCVRAAFGIEFLARLAVSMSSFLHAVCDEPNGLYFTKGIDGYFDPVGVVIRLGRLGFGGGKQVHA